jgi:hypothetical protein
MSTCAEQLFLVKAAAELQDAMFPVVGAGLGTAAGYGVGRVRNQQHLQRYLGDIEPEMLRKLRKSKAYRESVGGWFHKLPSLDEYLHNVPGPDRVQAQKEFYKTLAREKQRLNTVRKKLNFTRLLKRYPEVAMGKLPKRYMIPGAVIGGGLASLGLMGS